MARRRKFKPTFIVAAMIVGFFIIYFISFAITSNKDKNGDTNIQANQEQEAGSQKNAKETDKRSLITQISDSEKIYVTDYDTDYLKIDPTMWDEFNDFFSDFKKVRSAEKMTKPIYEGHNDDGVKFQTDLEYFKVFNVKGEEYYKIPVAEKKLVDNLMKKLIYTSYNYVNNYKDWDDVSVSDGQATKNVHFWNKDDLASNIIYKRVVGKVQPEKAFERTKKNFTVKISNGKTNIEIVTMGKDYVKITVAGQTAYYEVNDKLYKYLDGFLK